MGPIDAGIVVFFQAGWLIVVALLIRYILKQKDIIFQLRMTLMPFAALYDNGKYKETNQFTHHMFKRAFDVITGKQ